VNLSTTGVWLLVLGLALTTAFVKAAGPVLVGGRAMPRQFMRVVSFAAAPLLTALVVTSVLADGRRIGVGADTVGVLVGTVLLVCRVPLVVSAAAAVVVTAVLRVVA
jgi:branched-subunit amino acid transport protein